METWKPIPEWEGLYEVSNFGRVKSLFNGRWNIYREKILSPRQNSSGYMTVILCRRGFRKTVHVGRLVLSAFVAKMPPDIQCNHLDGNTQNNSLKNLEWVNQSGNMRHRFDVLHRGNPRGEQHGNSRFTEKEIVAIRRLKKNGITQLELSKLFGCSKSAIKHIVRRRSWSHVE